jgi:hypothetical protein
MIEQQSGAQFGCFLALFTGLSFEHIKSEALEQQVELVEHPVTVGYGKLVSRQQLLKFFVVGHPAEVNSCQVFQVGLGHVEYLG